MSEPTEPELDLEELRRELEWEQPVHNPKKVLLALIKRLEAAEKARDWSAKQLLFLASEPGDLDRQKQIRAAAIEECIKLVREREIEQGTAAEGADEPAFSIRIHAEAVLYNTVIALRELKDQ